MDFKLSVEERFILEESQSTSNKTLYVKITVLLGLDQGLSPSFLSNLLNISPASVYNYRSLYQEKGLDFYLDNRYLGFWGKLDSFQLACLDDELRTTLYKNSSDIAYWIYENFQIEYCSAGLVSLLHRLGFSYKKTKLIPAKANKAAQIDFVEDIESLLERLDNRELLFFCDAVHPQYNTRSNYAWIPKGKEAELKSVSGRQRVNINGVVNIEEPSEIVVYESKTVNTETTIELFTKLLNTYPESEKIYIVCDNASYYKSKAMKYWLETTRIELIYLPPYSPNLNPMERVWKLMRKEIIDYNYYEDFNQFRANVLSFFEYIADYKDKLETLITCRFHTPISKTNFY